MYNVYKYALFADVYIQIMHHESEIYDYICNIHIVVLMKVYTMNNNIYRITSISMQSFMGNCVKSLC